MKIIKLAENVLVPHPYEPILCKNVSADIFAFYFDDYSTDADMWENVARTLCLSKYQAVYIKNSIDSGCLIAERYYDKSLWCAHDIYKPFFAYYGNELAYQYIFIERI